MQTNENSVNYISKIKLPDISNPYLVKDAAAIHAEVTSADNGKFLRVVNGSWAAAAVPNAEDNVF